VQLNNSLNKGRYTMQLSPELLSDSVLVVDDDVEALEEMAEALQSYGLTVHTAINESMALKLAKEHRPKFIITDYLLDGYTGTEVVSAIHKFLPGTQTIIISAVEGLSRLVTTVNSDIITVLKKPFSIDLLSLFICNKLVQKHQQFRPIKQ
jgi:DNA-binding NtrC family response regulator